MSTVDPSRLATPPLGGLPARRLSADEKSRLGAEIQRRVGAPARHDEPLAPLTTMRVGGSADLFAVARNLFELRGLVRFARTHELPLFVLGRGSDLVVSDAGCGGLVVHVRASELRVDGRRITCEAGVLMARVATAAKQAGLSGAEFALAIPGTVGGAVWANAGAHGTDVRAILADASVILADGGAEEALDGPALGLAYRTSRLKESRGAIPDVVTRATFELEPAEPSVIAARLDEIRLWRQVHQPIGVPSAGSVFRNPPDGSAAGALIEQAGLKGLRLGGAAVSEKHANFIVNERGATAADVRRLAELVRRRVAERFGTSLQYEVVFAGDWSGWVEESDA